jgi:hypothetical protein
MALEFCILWGRVANSRKWIIERIQPNDRDCAQKGNLPSQSCLANSELLIDAPNLSEIMSNLLVINRRGMLRANQWTRLHRTLVRHITEIFGMNDVKSNAIMWQAAGRSVLRAPLTLPCGHQNGRVDIVIKSWRNGNHVEKQWKGISQFWQSSTIHFRLTS